MPRYRRCKGEKPVYTKAATARYFSQSVRWYKGRGIAPTSIVNVTDKITRFSFRTDEAKSLVHIVERELIQQGTPGGGGGGSGSPSFSQFCPFDTCMPDLQAVKVMTRFNYDSYIQVNYSDGVAVRVGFYRNTGSIADFPSASAIVRFPWTTQLPPNPDQLPYDNASYVGIVPNRADSCTIYITTQTETFSDTNVCGDEYNYGFTNFYADYFNGINTRRYLITTISWGEGGTTGGPVIGDDVSANPTGCEGGSSLESKTQTYYSYTDGGFFSALCSDGGDSPPPSDDGDPPRYKWTCNCPDSIQKQTDLPHRPWHSEQVSRSWAGSNAHQGLCKHIYSAQFASGTKPPNPLDREDPGDIDDEIIFDWDYTKEPPTDPVSNSGQDYDFRQARDWRRRVFERHQADYDAFIKWLRSPGNEQIAQYVDANQDYYREIGLNFTSDMTPLQRYNTKQYRRQTSWRGDQNAYTSWKDGWKQGRDQYRADNFGADPSNPDYGAIEGQTGDGSRMSSPIGPKPNFRLDTPRVQSNRNFVKNNINRRYKPK